MHYYRPPDCSATRSGDRAALGSRAAWAGCVLFFFTALANVVVADSATAGRPLADERGAIEFFEKRIRPLLAEQCYKCHSAESEKLKGQLRLDSRQGMLTGGDSGPAMVPGDPERSLLIKAVRYTDKDLQMP